MKFKPWMAVLLVLAGLTILGLGSWLKSRQPEQNSAITLEAWTTLQDSVAQATADLVAANKMIATLRIDSSGAQRKIQLQAATIATAQAELQAIKGGGVATGAGNGWSKYTDKFITAKFRQNPDSFQYMLPVRPLEINLIEGLNNAWACNARDVLANKPAIIKSFKVLRNADWQPKQAWYKKLRLGAGLGYYRGFHLAGEVGLGRNLFLPKVGVDENFKAVYGGTYIREIGF